MKMGTFPTIQELEFSVNKILEGQETVNKLQSTLGAINAEIALLEELIKAYKLLDRSTD